jgi:carboxylesterase
VAGVLCLHGLTGSPDELAPQARALAAAGLQVRVPLLAGHGAGVAALARTGRADWLRSAGEALTGLVADVGGPVSVVAASAGGLLAVQLAVRRPADVSRLVLLATPTRLPARAVAQIRLRLLVPRALRPARWAEIPKTRGPNVSDPSLAAGLRSLDAHSLEALGELLTLMRDTRARLPLVTQPVLLVHGVLDATVPEGEMDRLAAALTGAARVERLSLPNSAHLVGIDRDRDLLAARILDFLARP